MAAPVDTTFDDRDGWIWFDGEMVPWRDARVHVLTHALHYASSVFEGQRAYNGEIFKLREHSERLRKSASLLGFELPWTVDEINAACIEVLNVNGFTDAYMRPVAWRGSESMGVAPGKTKPHLAIAAWEWGKYYDQRKSEHGIRLDIAPWRRPAPYTAPTESKASGLYMICTLSKQKAEERGFDDALMFDWRGRVADPRPPGRMYSSFAITSSTPRRPTVSSTESRGGRSRTWRKSAGSRSASGRSGRKSLRASSRCS